MNPVIKNFRNLHVPGRPSTRLIGLDDNPPTCTMTYSDINPGQTSTHHIHSWEHEVYIISGSGTLMCDGKGYPVKAGDGIFIPGNVDHYTLNDGGARVIRRLEINPLVATQSGGARNNGGVGTGEPPVIRNRSELMGSGGVRLISSADGAPTYSMLYIELAGGQSSHQDAGGHTHPWEHVAYILEGHGTLLCDGQEYEVSEGDGILVPGNTHHQWRNPGQDTVKRLTFNPLAAEAAEG